MVQYLRFLLRTRARTAATRCFAMDAIPGDLKYMFSAAVKSVQPRQLINSAVRRKGNTLLINEKSYDLNGNCYIVGFGKAVLGMAVALEGIINDHIVEGIISVPQGIQNVNADNPEMTPLPNTKIQILEGAKNNIPDSDSLQAAKKIEDLVKTLNEGTLLFVLISGGGSALLPSPKSSLNFEEKSSLIQQLANRGANIVEMNCVRKRLSSLKGGGLAVAAFPAKIIALILSDVIGDPLDTISSGPTCVNTDERMTAFNVLQKYDLNETISDSLRSILLTEDTKCEVPISEHCYSHVNNILIGNNRMALQAAFVEATRLQYTPLIICSDLEGIAREVGENLAQTALEICDKFENSNSIFTLKQCNDISNKLHDALVTCRESKSGLCLIFGGETTVQVTGSGLGGRNQEMALAFALYLHNNGSKVAQKYAICLLSAGTDGIDGPTDAAGAVAYQQQIATAVQQQLEGEMYLRNNDSNTFYRLLKGGEDLVVTGHSGTNVMDLQMLIIKAVT